MSRYKLKKNGHGTKLKLIFTNLITVLNPYKDSSTILELAVSLISANINLSYNIIAAVFSLWMRLFIRTARISKVVSNDRYLTSFCIWLGYFSYNSLNELPLSKIKPNVVAVGGFGARGLMFW